MARLTHNLLVVTQLMLALATGGLAQNNAVNEFFQQMAAGTKTAAPTANCSS
jgi:hypothetical protein